MAQGDEPRCPTFNEDHHEGRPKEAVITTTFKRSLGMSHSMQLSVTYSVDVLHGTCKYNNEPHTSRIIRYIAKTIKKKPPHLGWLAFNPLWKKNTHTDLPPSLCSLHTIRTYVHFTLFLLEWEKLRGKHHHTTTPP